jgi:HD superfamily phosphodiesterase
VLENHASVLGHDFIAYRNHVYRVVNLCLAIAGRGDREEVQVTLEKIAVAAVFHDLGIWTNHTFDFLKHPLTPLPMVRL